MASQAGGTVTTDEFIALAEKESGMQLDDLFKTWLFTAREAGRAGTLARDGAARPPCRDDPRPVSGQPLGPKRSTRMSRGREAEVDQQLAGRLGERRRAAHVGRLARLPERYRSAAVSRPAGRMPCGSRVSTISAPAVHQLVGVGQLGERAAGDGDPQQVLAARAPGVPEHRDERDDAETAGRPAAPGSRRPRRTSRRSARARPARRRARRRRRGSRRPRRRPAAR